MILPTLTPHAYKQPLMLDVFMIADAAWLSRPISDCNLDAVSISLIVRAMPHKITITLAAASQTLNVIPNRPRSLTRQTALPSCLIADRAAYFPKLIAASGNSLYTEIRPSSCHVYCLILAALANLFAASLIEPSTSQHISQKYSDITSQ